MRLDLSNITLVVFENAHPDKAKALVEDMEKFAQFGKIHIESNFRTLGEFQRAEFNVDCNTSHLMTMHLDGFILNPEVWDPNWLKYDFIGAPWPAGHLQQFNPAWVHRMGNSGFSLRSKRLVRRAKPLVKTYGVFDLVVCQIARAMLINEGFKFAPIEEAAKFSVELPCPETPPKTFGFHGHWPSSENAPWFYKLGQTAKTTKEFVEAKEPRVILLTADGPMNDRRKFAASTHSLPEYHTVKVLHRDSREIGDERGCYFAKDVLDFSVMLTGDVFVYVNNDVALVPEWREVILPAVHEHGCAFSQRVDVTKFTRALTLDEINGPAIEPYLGSDLFAFTPKWWAEHRNDFPDQAMLGGEGWDAVLTWLMCQSGFRRGKTVCYHERHPNWWSDPKNQNSKAAGMNRLSQAEWANRNGLQHLLALPEHLWKREIFCFE